LVPTILHQIWLGDSPLPEEFAAYRETWQRHHPGWEHRFWTEDNLPSDLRRPEVYERLRVPAERSDILRLEVLWRVGGVYADTDFECLRPLDPVIEGLDFFTAPLKPNGWVNNAFIGAIPGHPIIDRALNALQPREFHGYDKHGTGPRFLDTLLREYPEATRLPAELFYQTSPGQLADAVASHHAAGSWKDIESYRNAVGLAERRNFELRGQIETLEREVEALRAKVARAEEATAGRRGFLRR
jgi:inositol phosphorylceramide mannosyltransferase catalytic subunit